MSIFQLKIQLVRMLAGLQKVEDIDFRPIKSWIARAHLGAAMFEIVGKHSQFTYPSLQEQYYANIFRQTVQQKVFQELVSTLVEKEKDIDILLLKGAAISPIAWEQPYLRYQADVDFMVPRKSMQLVSDQMHAARFQFKKPDKIGRFFTDLPATNKEGQLEMFKAGDHDVMIEVHSEVFLGHVHRTTTRRKESELWADKVPAENGLKTKGQLWRLSNEDLLLHTLVHTAINHQFNRDTFRNMIDLIRLANRLEVDWERLERRIKEMKLVTPIWLTLSLIDAIFGSNTYSRLLQQLPVGRFKQRLLHKLVNPARLLSLYEISTTRMRYVLLFLMVDRPLDMLRLLVKLPKIMQDG